LPGSPAQVGGRLQQACGLEGAVLVAGEQRAAGHPVQHQHAGVFGHELEHLGAAVRRHRRRVRRLPLQRRQALRAPAPILNWFSTRSKIDKIPQGSLPLVLHFVTFITLC